MPDTAADILAPPDPTWNPPPTDTGMLSANPQPDVLAARGASDAPPPAAPPQPPDPNMITPAGAAAPYTPPPQFQPPTPQEEGAKHESFLHHILDKVGSILGGEQTIHVTRDADGNLTVSHDPSTTGEKWGRVAMAALGGAAKGAAASQGPGGLAKAASAGAEWGMQLPQQMREQADAQVTADQKRQMMNANNALIHQKSLQTTIESQDLQLNLNDKTRAVLQGTLDDLKSSPYAHDYGPVSNMQETMEKVGQAQQLLHDHTNLTLKTTLMPKKGGGWETHLIATDPGADMQPVKPGSRMPKLDIDPKTGEPTLSEGDLVSPNMKNGAYNIARSAIITQFGGLKNGWDKAHKPATDKEPTTQDAAIIAKYHHLYPNDPAKALNEATKEIQKNKVQVKATKAGGGTGEMQGNPLLPTTTGATNAELPDEGTFLSQFTVKPTPQGQAILDKLPTGQANLVQRFGNYIADEGKELPRGKERQPFLELVSAVYPGFDSAHYDARKKTVESLQGDGKIAQSRNALNLTIQHMGEMYDAMQTIDPGEYPIANNAAKTYHLSGGFGDKEVKGAYGGYADANEGVASEMARVFKGGQPTQTEVNHYRGNADPTLPRSTQEGSFKTRAAMLSDRMNTINRQLQDSLGTPGKNYRLLSPEAIQTLQRLPGGTEVLERNGYAAAPPPTGNPPTPTPAAVSVEGEPNFKASAKQPATPPGPNKIFGTGSKGLGWYPIRKGG